MNRATICDLQQTLALLIIKCSMQSDAARYAFDAMFAINAILSVDALVQQAYLNIIKRHFF